MAISGKKRIRSNRRNQPDSGSQVHPNSYFEQLEPRIILGSCLALGGAEALLGQAQAAENDPQLSAPPPPGFGALNPQNNFSPATELPRLFSWQPSSWPFEGIGKNGLVPEPPKPSGWLSPQAGGSDISDKLKLQPQSRTGQRFLPSPSPGRSGGGGRLAGPALNPALNPVLDPAPAPSDPQIIIRPIDPVKPGPGGEDIDPPVTNTLVLGASGAGQVEVGQEYALSLSASGPGAKSIRQWTIDWGDGTVEDIQGNPGQVKHTYNKVGDYVIKTSATNAEKIWTGPSVPVSAFDNRPPVFESEPSLEAGVDRPWYYQAVAVDPDGDEVSYALVSGPQGMTIDTASGLLSWTPGAGYVGQHQVIIAASDDRGNTARQEFELSVTAELQNRPPEIISTPGTSAPAGSEYVYQVQARDPDGDLLTYILESGPAGMEMDAAGKIIWTPTADLIGQTVAVRVAVEDGHGGRAWQEFELAVTAASANKAPVFVSDPNTSHYVAENNNKATGTVSEERLDLVADIGEIINRLASLNLSDQGVMVDVFLLFDDTGSFSGTAPKVKEVFPEIIAQLTAALPNINFGFGVGRFEDYGGNNLPFILNQPIVSTETEGFWGSIDQALNRTAPGNGGDTPESLIEALYQLATGAGFDGNYNGTTTDSGPAGLASTQTDPNWSGDVPAFDSFLADVENGVLNPQGNIGGGGFRSGALPIIICATDTGFAYQPDGRTEITGANDVSIPTSYFTGGNFRASTPYGQGAAIQETIDALRDIGALVLGLGTNDTARYALEALSLLTGAVNGSSETIDNYTSNPIDTGDPYYFHIGSNASSLAGSLVAAISAAILNTNHDIEVIASKDGVPFANLTGVIKNVHPGDLASFDLSFEGDGFEHSFDIQFVKAGTGVILGSIPVTIGTPYQYQAQAIDPDGDEITYALSGDSHGAQIDSATGLITWNPAGNGLYTFTVVATDARGNSAEQIYDVQVGNRPQNAPAPVISGLSNIQAEVGRDFSSRVLAEAPGGGALSYFLMGQVPDGLTISRSTGEISWNPAMGQEGLQEFTVRVVSSEGVSSEMTVNLEVLEKQLARNSKPVFTSQPSLRAVYDQQYSYTIEVRDAEGDPVTLRLLMAPDGLILDAAAGRLLWTPGEEDRGSHRIIIQADDGQGGLNMQTFELEVTGANLPPVFTSSPPATALTGADYLYVAEAVDPDGGPVTYRLDSASLALGASINAYTGLLSWSNPPEGRHSLTVIAADAEGEETSQTFSLEVTVNLPPRFVSDPVTVALKGQPYAYQIVMEDPNNDQVSLSLDQASVDRGMYIDADGVLRWQSETIGEYRVILTVTDPGGLGMSQQFSISVVETVPVNQSPVITSEPEIRAWANLTYTYRVVAADPDAGDKLTYQLSTDKPASGLSIDASGRVIWPVPVAGEYLVTITVTDKLGARAIQTFTLTVGAMHNRPPRITTAPGNYNYNVGDNFSYQLGYYDTDSGDEWEVTLDQASLDRGMTVTSLYAGAALIEWTPGQSGTFTTTVTVTDRAGAQAVQTFSLRVFEDSEKISSNRPPQITSSPVAIAYIGEAYSYKIAASDPDGDVLVLSLDDESLARGLKINDSLITWAPEAGDEGEYMVTITARDPQGAQYVQSYVLIVAERPPAENQGAYFTNADKIPRLGVNYQETRFTLEGLDPEGGQVSFYLVGTSNINGMKVEGNELIWTPTWGARTGTATLRAADEHGEGEIITLTLTVINNNYGTNYYAGLYEGESLNYEINYIPYYGTLTDLTLSQAAQDLGMVLDGNVLKWTTGAGSASPIPYVADIIAARVYNGKTFYDALKVYISVLEPVNKAPVITSTPVTKAVKTEIYQYQVEAYDPEGGSLTYALEASSPAFFNGNYRAAVDENGLLSAYVNYYQSSTWLTIRVTDDHGNSTRQLFYLTVEPPAANRPPVITSLPPKYILEVGEYWNYAFYTDDPDRIFRSDPCTFSLNPEAVTAGFNLQPYPNGVSGYIIWTPSAANLGSHEVILTATDAQGASVSQTFMIHVVEKANRPIYFTSTPNPLAIINEKFTYYIATTDAYGGARTLSLDQESIDRGLVLSSSQLIWTPGALGDFTVTLTATDGLGSIATQTFVIRVVERQAYGGNKPAAITSPPLAIGYVGGVYLYEIEASDPDGGPVTLSLDEKSLARGMYLDGRNLIWDHPTVPGAYVVAITAVDEFGAGQTQTFRLHILDNKRFNHAPVITSQPSPAAVVGREYTYQVKANDVDGDDLVYTLAQGPAGISIDPVSGLLRFTPSQTGLHQIEIMVTDGNHILSQSFYLLVTADLAPIITSTPRLWGYMGQEYVYQATAIEANGDRFTWHLESGSPGMVIDEANGRFTFNPTATGVFQVTIVARDEYGQESRQTFSFVIWDAQTNTPPRITSGMREFIPVGHSFTHLLTAVDPDHENFSFSLSSGPAGMSVTAAGLLVWTPSSDQVGIHKFTVRATDTRDEYSEVEYSLSVVAEYVNESPAFTSSPPPLAVAGSDWVYQAQAVDPDGDSLYFMIDQAPAGLTVDPQSGLFRWQPNLAQLGEHEISVRVVDAYGAWSTQAFTVKVQAANTAPIIVSTPPTVGKVGAAWVYQAVAEDGEGDEIEFYLGPDCPSTMQIDSRTGLVAFTSAVEGEFLVELYVKDSRGAVSGQRFTLAIKPEAINLPPEVTSTPGFYAAPGQEYVYQVLARDPNGDALAYSLRSAPEGMSIDAAGRLTWTPTEAQAGEHRIEIAIFDGQDGIMQSYLLKVLKNSAPAFGDIPDQTVIAGTEFVLEAKATDPDRDVLKYDLIEAPAGMTVDETGRLRWSASAIPAGGSGQSHQVVLRATDPFGEEARVAFTLTVTADTEAPEVYLSANKGPAAINDPVSFLVRAHDAGGVAGMYLVVDGQKVAVNANGLATVVFDRPGEHTVLARALDQAGNVGQASMTIIIIDPADQQPPTVEWNIPGGLVLDDLQEIRATVFDPDSGTVDWVLTLRAAGSETEHLLAQGSGRLDNQVLETLDPTLWANGPYVLTLTAVDGSGHKTWVSETIIVKSHYKLGNFNLSFQDLEVNVGGIPIIIQRSYDTFESGVSGDFGYGWSLTYIPVSIRDNTGYDLTRDPTAAYYSDAALYHGAKLTVRMPDGKNAVFTVEAQGMIVQGMYKIKLVAEDGVDATLSIEGNPILTMDSENRFMVGGYTPFNPASEASPYNYILTTADGVKYRINGRSGQCSRADAPGGERIEISGSGIRSYDAKGALVNEVQFLRDDQGRITTIIDPKGDQKVTYEYSAEGDLIAVNNSKTGKVELTYLNEPEAPAHYLKSIIDHRGVTAIDVAYDYTTGRITGITGADGTSAGVGFVQKVGPGLNAEMVTDALGRVTETVVDLDGNIIRTIKHLPDPTNRDKLSYYITVEEFDAKGNSLGKARPFTVTEAELRALGKNQYDYLPDDIFWTSRSTYDNKGNQLTSTDSYGQITYYSYDKYGNVLKMVDPLGRVTENKYDANGRPTQTVDYDGTISVYHYHSEDLIKSITRIKPDGTEQIQTTLEYDRSGNITRMIDAYGNDTRYGYDDQGRAIFIETTSLDPNNPDVTHTTVTYQEYDENDNVILSWQELDGVETSRTGSVYDSDGLLLSSTDQYGLVTRYIYDINGNEIEMRQQTVTENGDKVWLISRTVYDAAGQVIWSQEEHLEADPDKQPQAAKAAYYVYDDIGRLVKSELREQVVIALSGQDLHLITVVEDSGSLLSSSATRYDDSGRTAWTENNYGVKTVYVYTPEGSWSHTFVDIDGDLNTLEDQYITVKAIFDEYGREIQAIKDADGNLSTTDDQTIITNVYDNQGRIIKKIYSDGTFTATSFDAIGNIASETDQLGRTTYYEYDSNGRLTAVILPQVKHQATGEMVHVRYEYAYNAAGKQTSLRDNIFQSNPLNAGTIDRSGQRETAFEYDWRGNQISRTLPDGSQEHFFYDAQGRQQKHVSFEGRITYYEYDAFDRFSRIIFYSSHADFNNGLAAKALSYTYDLWGRVIREVDTKNGATLTSYDAVGNISRIESPQGIINYEYDSTTGQISRTWTGGDSTRPITDIHNTYDKLGRLESVTTYAREGAVLSTPETARYVYDLIGNLDKIIQANGIISDYDYDQLNRLKELTHYAPDDTPEDLSDNDILQRYTYDYYQDGNKSGETFIDKDGAAHTWNWVYDQLGRLIREVHDNADDSLDYTTDYIYDLVGNRLLKQTDKGNDGTVDEEVRSVFDQNDRLKSETEIAGGVQSKRTDYVYNKTEQIAKTVIDLINSRTESKTTMEYDAQGRMSKINIETYTNGLKAETVTQEYIYDSGGIKIRQVEKVDANADGVIDSESVTNYLNEFLNHTGYAQVLEERLVENGQEVKVTTYTIGHDVLAQFDTVNGYLALLYDGHGSTRAVADGAGRIVQQYNYDAYGNAHGFDAKDALTNLLYSGEQFNPVSGLQYLRARWYDPQSGRFNRLDPFAGNKQSPLSFHKYAYAHMNPIMNIDPSGLISITELGIANFIQTSLAILNKIWIVYNTVDKAIALWGFARQVITASKFLYNAFQADAPGGFAEGMKEAIRQMVRANGADFQQAYEEFLPTITDMFDKVGSKWKEYGELILENADDIAARTWSDCNAHIVSNAPYIKHLKFLIFMPSPPTGKSSGALIPIGTTDYKLYFQKDSGRIIGFGTENLKNKMRQQYLRIDYWGAHLKPSRPYLHFHTMSQSPPHLPIPLNYLWQGGTR